MLLWKTGSDDGECQLMPKWEFKDLSLSLYLPDLKVLHPFVNAQAKAFTMC